MGRTGSCLDNAVVESFFAALKASSSNASITAPAPAPKREPGSSVAVGERVTDHLPVLRDRRWWPNCDRSSAVRPLTLETASASSKPKERTAFLGRLLRAGLQWCSGELVANCWCWTKWCTDAVEMADGFGVGAEQGGLAVGEVVLLAERPD
jgi:hypothetical protein